MAEPESKGRGAKPNPDIGPLYVKFSGARLSANGNSVLLPGVLDMLGGLSVTSQFKISLHLVRGKTGGSDLLIDHLDKTGILEKPEDVVSYDFFCSDALLPGVSFNSYQELGSRQGVIENFPSIRIYPPFEVTFYVDSEFKIIRLFEEWINFINPLYTENGIAETSTSGMGKYNSSSDFFRLRYPEDYRRIISVTKFERNFRKQNTGELGDVPSITYRLIDAYPDQLNSIPVTYEGSVITKTTVRFLYSRFVMEKNKGANNDLLRL